MQPSMLQIFLAFINLILAMQSSSSGCANKGALQCPPVGVAAALLIVEVCIDKFPFLDF